MLDLADRTETRFEVVKRILDVEKAPDGLFFQVRWEALADKRDWTWQSATDLYKNIPNMVKTFLQITTKKQKLVKNVNHQLGIQA